MSEPKFEMKAEVRDKVTGFTGYITASLLYMTGCVQYQVEASEGIELKAYWIDEDRLELIEGEVEEEIEEKGDERIYKHLPSKRTWGGGPSRGPSAY